MYGFGYRHYICCLLAVCLMIWGVCYLFVVVVVCCGFGFVLGGFGVLLLDEWFGFGVLGWG